MRNLLHHSVKLTANHSIHLMVNNIWHMPRNMISGLITLYQNTLSPDHGPLKHLWPHGYCRHEPTCSEYTRQQVTRRGAAVGLLLGGKRVLTCHPWRKPSDAKILKTIS